MFHQIHQLWFNYTINLPKLATNYENHRHVMYPNFLALPFFLTAKNIIFIVVFSSGEDNRILFFLLFIYNSYPR